MSISAEIIRLFYDLWDATLPGREFVLSAHTPESWEKLSRSSAGDVRGTLRRLNRIGHLLAQGALDPAFVTSLIGREVLRLAPRLQPGLEEERSRRSDPQYFEHVDKLFDVCRAAYPDYEPHYYQEERRNLGLMSRG
jgi:hypothetical protein